MRTTYHQATISQTVRFHNLRCRFKMVCVRTLPFRRMAIRAQKWLNQRRMYKWGELARVYVPFPPSLPQSCSSSSCSPPSSSGVARIINKSSKQNIIPPIYPARAGGPLGLLMQVWWLRMLPFLPVLQERSPTSAYEQHTGSLFIIFLPINVLGIQIGIWWFWRNAFSVGDVARSLIYADVWSDDHSDTNTRFRVK